LFDVASRAERWTVADGWLTFHHSKLEVFWKVPRDFNRPSLGVLGLAEFLLLKPHGEAVELPSGFQRSRVICRNTSAFDVGEAREHAKAVSAVRIREE